MGQQTRIGASLGIPGARLRIAADYDLSANETLADGTLSRSLGGGLEVPFGNFALRGGMSVNLEAPDRPYVYSFGLGFGSAKAKLDVSAVYSSNDNAYGGVLTARVGF